MTVRTIYQVWVKDKYHRIGADSQWRMVDFFNELEDAGRLADQMREQDEVKETRLVAVQEIP